MADANEKIIDTFTAVAVGTTYKYRKRADNETIAYQLCPQTDGGTLTATVKLQTSIPDLNSWIDVPSGSFTASTTGTFTPGGDMDIRWNCTAYTDGTIRARLG